MVYIVDTMFFLPINATFMCSLVSLHWKQWVKWFFYWNWKVLHKRYAGQPGMVIQKRFRHNARWSFQLHKCTEKKPMSNEKRPIISFIQSLLFGCVRVFLRPKASCHFLVKGYQYAATTSSAARKVSMAFHRKFSLNVPMYTFPAKRSLNLDTSIPRFKVHTWCKHMM